jgi:hypothetical protein
MAGWVTIVGSVFVVFGLFETVANLRSIETREQVERMLSQPPLEGTGMTVERWLSVLHTVSLVGAACAAAAAILGFYVLQRSTSARAALTVVAVPLFLTGLVTSGFMSTLVAVSALMLWTRPARDWFAGRPWLDSMMSARTEATAKRRGRDLADPSSEQPPTPPAMPWEQPAPPAPSDEERPMPATGDARPHAGFGEAAPRPVVPAPRPAALVTACVLTWVFAGVVALGCLLGLVGMLVSPDLWSEQMREDLTEQAGVTWEQARRAALGAAAVFGAWSLVALLLAVFAFLGREWARILLVISASSAAMLIGLSLVTAGVAGLVMLLPLAACVATVVLLLRRDVSGWVRGHSVR